MKRFKILHEYASEHVPGHLLKRFIELVKKESGAFIYGRCYEVKQLDSWLKQVKEDWEKI